MNNFCLKLKKHLNYHSYFSLRYETHSPQRLANLTKQYKVKTLAFTDISNSTSIIDFVKIHKKNNIKSTVVKDLELEKSFYTVD